MIEITMTCDVCGCEGRIAERPEQKCIDALKAKIPVLLQQFPVQQQYLGYRGTWGTLAETPQLTAEELRNLLG